MREAAKRGRLLGKPSKLSALQRRRLLADYESGEYSAAQLMDISGLSRSAMYATLNKHGKNTVAAGNTGRNEMVRGNYM